MKRILIEKEKRRLTLSDGARLLLSCPIALGKCPVGHKARAGDNRTPEGAYFVCLKRGTGKFGPALGVSYPSPEDARAAGLDEQTLAVFDRTFLSRTRPPWGTALGGEIYIHGRGADGDWTAGCVALSDGDMAALFLLAPYGTDVLIVP